MPRREIRTDSQGRQTVVNTYGADDVDENGVINLDVVGISITTDRRGNRRTEIRPN